MLAIIDRSCNKREEPDTWLFFFLPSHPLFRLLTSLLQSRRVRVPRHAKRLTSGIDFYIEHIILIARTARRATAADSNWPNLVRRRTSVRDPPPPFAFHRRMSAALRQTGRPLTPSAQPPSPNPDDCVAILPRSDKGCSGRIGSSLTRSAGYQMPLITSDIIAFRKLVRSRPASGVMQRGIVSHRTYTGNYAAVTIPTSVCI
jgi:hypothetical protein